MSSPSFKKPFSQELYEANDSKAKTLAIEIYKGKGRFVIENIFDVYGADLLEVSRPSGKTIKVLRPIEVERKQSWKTHKWTYSTLRIASRKLKLLGAGDCDLLMFNEAWTACMIVPGSAIAAAPIEVAETKYSQGMEETFIIIDPSLCEWIELKKTEPQTKFEF